MVEGRATAEKKAFKAVRLMTSETCASNQPVEENMEYMGRTPLEMILSLSQDSSDLPWPRKKSTSAFVVHVSRRLSWVARALRQGMR